jgi:hypothetical protein
LSVPALVLAFALSVQPSAEVLADVQVHGNVLTAEDEILRLAQVQVGMPFTDDMLEQVASRLRAADRFASVAVQKRFASIADPTQIALVILVDEGPVTVQETGDPSAPARLVRSGGPGLLFAPIFNIEDGYGVTYGVRLAKLGPFGRSTRASFPFTWGGTKRAGAEVDFERAGPLSRIQIGFSLARRENPFFEENDDRARVWTRAEYALLQSLRIGATGGWQAVRFAGLDDRYANVGAEMVFDTRVDPMLSRNAVYARLAWDRFALPAEGVGRIESEVRGYLGLAGQSILVGRGMMSDARDPLPPISSRCWAGCQTCGDSAPAPLSGTISYRRRSSCVCR